MKGINLPMVSRSKTIIPLKVRGFSWACKLSKAVETFLEILVYRLVGAPVLVDNV